MASGSKQPCTGLHDPEAFCEACQRETRRTEGRAFDQVLFGCGAALVMLGILGVALIVWTLAL